MVQHNGPFPLNILHLIQSILISSDPISSNLI